MLRTIRLYGDLAKRHGDSFKLSVETPKEAVHALLCQLPGFEQDIRKGEFVCVRGDYETGVECDELLLHLRFGQLQEFHIIPASVGRKGGIGKILIGFALIAATVFTAGAALGFGTIVGGFSAGGLAGGLAALSAGLGGFGLFGLAVGGLFILGGAAMLLAPMPKAGNFQETDSKPGFLFSGAANTASQGGACPLVFGRIRAGSVIVSAGITAERIGAASIDYSSTGGIISYTNMEFGALP